ncbi:MAG TPA: BamA/TamA family outer membrane protein, partial [Gemmatimonadaceae bacterium]
TTADFVQLESQYIRFNFLGSARRLTLTATFSNLFADALNGEGFFYDVTNGAGGPMRDLFLRPTWSVSADFVQPWFFSPNNQIGTTIFAHRRAVPGIMIDRGFGATGAFTHNFGMRSNTTLGYTFELSEIDASDVYFCVNFGVCVTETIDILGGRHQLAPLSSVTQIDVANDPFTPNRGYRVQIDAEHASSITFSDFRFNRIEVNGSAYFGVTRRSTLATHLRLGWVDPIGGTTSALGLGPTVEERIVHPRKRFYAGGSQSVRGFGERQLGPRVLTISPDALTDTALASHCTTTSIRDGTCNPNIPGLPSDAFQPQPLGGTVLAEASVEWRFPLLPARGLTGAVFLDGALIGTNQLSDLLGATGAITPGFGVRLETPVGPVRLDLGIRPTLVERLPVITQVEGRDGELRLVTLSNRRRFDPLDDTGSFLRRVLSRLRLHLAIGEAF